MALIERSDAEKYRFRNLPKKKSSVAGTDLSEIASITIDPEFQHMFSVKTPEEYEALKENIRREGRIRDALVVWLETNTLLDGHHRRQIGIEISIKPCIIRLSFASRDDARMWIYLNQRDRRNMNPFQQIEAALSFKPMYVARAKANQRASGGAVPQKSAKPVDVRKEVAKLANTSHDTVSKVESILQKASEDEIDALRRGDAGISINGVSAKYTGKAKPTSAAMKKVKPEKEIPSEQMRSTEGEKYIKEILRLAKELRILFGKIQDVPHDEQELEKARLQISNVIEDRIYEIFDADGNIPEFAKK